ncbi:FGGY carbohydrate kinase domain-containing protein-like isoform X2 [Anthonomus grandis grandis]|nr:FGGY carbohydrate kinase domain-containing protein-like isoform X2 [Anthonomus grandis grandis]
MGIALRPCKLYEKGIFCEMSSEEVWNSLKTCIKKAVSLTKGKDIKGIGFTALPALVTLDKDAKPLTASTSRNPNINVIIHFDKRSCLEALKIAKTRHSLLRYLGDNIHADIYETKLLWLKNNLREECWDKVGHFFSLTDFLTWKATGSLVRSSSTLRSLWSYEITANGKEGWNAQYFTEIGIPEVADDNFKMIGSQIQRPGTPIENGLSENLAIELGLPPHLPVPSGLPDMYAGCLGIIGCNVKEITDDVTRRLCIVYDMKSASQFVVSHEPHFITGVRGPFLDCVLPNKWLNHAGQTTAESILEYIIDTHPASAEIRKQIAEMHIHKYLNKILKTIAQKKNLTARTFLTRYVHVLPDINGNHSPLADPYIRGMISGLTGSYSQESLAILYLAAMQSIAYSSKHIISTMTQNGHDIRSVIIGGHMGKNSLFASIHRDITRLPVVIPDEPKCKLMGAAILAGIASQYFRDFDHAMQEMCGSGQVLLPDDDSELIEYHEKKYQVFLKMYDHQLEYRRIMGDVKEETVHVFHEA